MYSEFKKDDIQTRGVSISVKLDDPFMFMHKFKPLDIMVILDNLIDNSIKAAATRIEIHIKKLENGVEVRVRDNGKGIPTKNLNKIYESDLEYQWTGVITTIDYIDTSGSKTPFEAINPIFKKLLCLDWDKSDLASFNLQLGRKINDYFVNYNIHGYEKRKIKFKKDQTVKFVESKAGNELGVQILLDINNKPMNLKKNPKIDLDKIILKQFELSKSIEEDLNIEGLL